MNSSSEPAPGGASALLDAAPRFAPGLRVRRIPGRAGARWVLHNPATGRYFQAGPALYALASRFDGTRRVGAALDEALVPEAERAELLAGLGAMLGAGLLVVPGFRPPPRLQDRLAALRVAAYHRRRLGDFAPALGVLDALLGWLFTRAGALVLAALLLLAAIAWSGRGAELAAQGARLASADLADLALGYLVFLAAKLLHEAGHAVALRRMLRAEGLPAESVPWGVSFMFLLPAPFVDASAAWLLASRARRAAVGLAGVATDLLVAALAALAWAATSPGALHDRLFDLVLICGVSSLVFNLNPLVRLDGYHVLADLTGIANLAARAQAALARALLGPLGLAPRGSGGEAPLALYAAASWLYRWTIYLAIFWLAASAHWLLAAGVALVVAVLFVALPLARAAAALPGAFGRSPGGAAAGLALLALLLGAAAFWPLPRHVVAMGVVAGPGLGFAYARSDGRLVSVAPPGELGEAPALVLENPEIARLLVQLRAEGASLAIEARRARASGERVDTAAERERAVAEQIARLEEERAALVLRAPPGALWEPLRAERLPQAWLRRDDSRPLGAWVLRDAPVEFRFVLDLWSGPAALEALAAAPDAAIPLRAYGAAAAQFAGRLAGPAMEARDALPSPSLGTPGGGPIPARLDAREEARPEARVFELRLRPVGALPPLAPGQRVEARIALPPAPLAEQAWTRARQALQRRLAV